VIVCVPTYNRPALFERLVASIAAQPSPVTVIAFDDASPRAYAEKTLRAAELPHHVRRMPSNHGRARFSVLLHALLTHHHVRDAAPDTLVWLVADDFVFAEDAFARGRALLERTTQMPGCVGVSAHTDHRGECWSLPCTPYDDEGERLGWQDGVFLTYAHRVAPIAPRPRVRRGIPRENGTGVWQEASSRLHAAGGWWYRPYVTLTRTDDGGVSRLNPWWNGRERLTRTREA
jgi:glycosyltransferase involved in cell wall biosynthesis